MRIPRPTYSGVVASLALFVALGGSSYAALSVSGKHIRNGTVTGSDLKDGTIKGRDVDNGSLQAKDFKAGELPAGPQGPVGPAGPQGATGPQGPAGGTNVVTRRDNVTIAKADPSTTIRRGSVSCAAGEIATGGGTTITNVLTGVSLIVTDGPIEADGSPPEAGEPATGWEAVGINYDDEEAQVMVVHAYCVTP
jgi:hypothetical protein